MCETSALCVPGHAQRVSAMQDTRATSVCNAGHAQRVVSAMQDTRNESSSGRLVARVLCLQCRTRAQRVSAMQDTRNESSCVLDAYCSTVQGLLDWFEVDLGFTELSFTQIDSCVLCVFALYSRVSLSSVLFFGHSALPPARGGSASRVSPQSRQRNESCCVFAFSLSVSLSCACLSCTIDTLNAR